MCLLINLQMYEPRNTDNSHVLVCSLPPSCVKFKDQNVSPFRFKGKNAIAGETLRDCQCCYAMFFINLYLTKTQV